MLLVAISYCSLAYSRNMGMANISDGTLPNFLGEGWEMYFQTGKILLMQLYNKDAVSSSGYASCLHYLTRLALVSQVWK